MRKVIFLDRDGVINKERGDYTYKIDDFIINNDVIEFLTIAKHKGYEFIIISNQGGISKKIYNHNDVFLVHEFMLKKFRQVQIEIVNIYYCPHHSAIEKCICRKPNSLLIEKAIARYEIDKSNSFLIGDSKRDIDAASNARIKGYLIPPNSSLLLLKNELNWL